jgi:hypothetical protein
MEFRAACISPNTPDAVTANIAIPTIVAMILEDVTEALAMADCNTSAVCRPIRALNWLLMAF